MPFFKVLVSLPQKNNVVVSLGPRFFKEETIKKINTNGIEIVKYLDTYLYSFHDFHILSNTILQEIVSQFDTIYFP